MGIFSGIGAHARQWIPTLSVIRWVLTFLALNDVGIPMQRDAAVFRSLPRFVSIRGRAGMSG